MFRRTGDRPFRSVLRLAGALYAIFLVATPFEHHDLSCELKTPQHCTACVSSPLGSDPDTTGIPVSWDLADAGRADSPQIVSHGLLLVVRTSGRSPPTIL